MCQSKSEDSSPTGPPTALSHCCSGFLLPCSQSYGFPSGNIWMWGWTVKKAECQRIDAFELWCWRRLLRVPWTARKSNQSILKEISPECSLEGLMLKFQYFGHLMQRTDSLERPWCWERLKAGGEGDDRGWDGWMASPTRWTWVWASSGRWWRTGKPGVLQSMGSQRVGHDWVTELNWTDCYSCHLHKLSISLSYFLIVKILISLC